jgi:glycosyltransferase involved in cell wall biosynthesis
MTRRAGLISVAVPCFNEQHSIGPFMQAITPALESAGHEYEILFVDDGSSDDTLPMLVALAGSNPHVKVLALSRNFGKEAALTAALDFVSGDAVIPIDADLQDPVELIPQMVAKWEAGTDVVLAQRKSRPDDSMLRRGAARFFYKLIAKLSHFPIPENVGDYRLMDRKVIECVRQLPERTRYMKGLLAWPGFRSEIIEFTRPQRHTGNSKWPVWKLFNHGLDGIFSFSTAPLRIWTYFGFALSAFSLAYLCWVVIKTLIFGIDWPGYASTLSVILFFNGIILMGLGVLGEYLGRVFIEVKGRPIYLVKSKTGFKDDSATEKC